MTTKPEAMDPKHLQRVSCAVVSILGRAAQDWRTSQLQDQQLRANLSLGLSENDKFRTAVGMAVMGLARAIDKDPQLLLKYAEIEQVKL